MDSYNFGFIYQSKVVFKHTTFRSPEYPFIPNYPTLAQLTVKIVCHDINSSVLYYFDVMALVGS